VAAFPGDGFRDLARRFRIARAWVARLRVRRALATAESELGWLGWEQVDFFDEQVAAEVEKVRAFENTQASLLNTAAELGARKGALDQELAAEIERNQKTNAELDAERGPLAARFEQADSRRRLKLAAVERFERALEELVRTQRELETRSRDFMEVVNLDAAGRAESREISDALGRIPGEIKHVMGDKATAAQEAAALEPEVVRLRIELDHIQAAINEESERFSAGSRRIAGEIRQLERERKKSDVHMTRLDRKKHGPYRAIGACLADQGIAPRNQPEILEKVLVLRERDGALTETMGAMQAVCAAASPSGLAAFYIFLAVILIGLVVLAAHHF
jgi:hypothetical protein